MKRALNNLVELSHERLRRSKIGFDYLAGERQISVDLIKREKMGFIDKDIASSFLDEVDVDRWTHPVEYYLKMMVGRVVLPIRNDCGVVVGFSTKVPEKDSKGWWNSLFNKEKILYGLNRAKNVAFSKNKIYLVEGYADALRMWQAGVVNTVAVMGTAFTEVQQGLVLRYCNNICICFDTDPCKDGRKGGGQAGLERIVSEYNASGYFNTLSAIVLPLQEDGKGEDPDSFIRKNCIKDYLSLERRILLY